MQIKRPWAFWRQVQYATGFGVVILGGLTWIYFSYFFVAASCFDLSHNGDERGIDCGGACARICTFDVIAPEVQWARSFKVVDGQYNAVAYIENRNELAATPEISYTFTLYDEAGLITERSGTTILPSDSVYPVFEGRIQTGNRIPTQTFIELGKADLWLPASAGRDQFRVVERELVGADADPRINATIANQALTPAAEVEVVATIFDARGNALTASRTFIDEFAARSETDVVFTWPEPIAKTMRSCEVPTDVVVAIDLSGSMNNDQAEPPEPISSVLVAADSFVSRLRPQDQAAVITFATEALTNLTLSSDASLVSATVQNLVIAPEEETGNTNTGEAFVRAREELDSLRHNPNARKVVVLLTDGLATTPEPEPELFATEQADLLKLDDVEIYVIGLGESVNMNFLRSVATDPGYAFQAVTRNQVDAIYNEITGAICEDGAAVIDIVPKSDAGFQSLQ